LPEFYAAQRQSSGDYSEVAHRTYPLYDVFKAILIAVETIDSMEYDSVAAMRSVLISAASNVNAVTAPPHYRIEEAAMTEEREKFINYIQAISPTQLDSVPPLYYSRRLRSSEVQRISRLFKERWHAEIGHWYPLTEKPEGVDVEAFHITIFSREVGYERLRRMLLRRGVSRIFEVHESGQSGYELDVGDSDPEYGYEGMEVWWTNGEGDFVVYASHESSITFAGWILDEVRKAWPQWKSNTYTGWDQA
jgi:hypothetical protein